MALMINDNAFSSPYLAANVPKVVFHHTKDCTKIAFQSKNPYTDRQWSSTWSVYSSALSSTSVLLKIGISLPRPTKQGLNSNALGIGIRYF